jgi:hypothetical protein
MGREANVKSATEMSRRYGSIAIAALDVMFPDLPTRTLRRIEKRVNPRDTRLPPIRFERR